MKIVGDPSLCMGQVSLNDMKRSIKGKREVYLLELATLFENQLQQSKKTVSKDIQRILSRFQEVFKTPTGLPPIR